MFEPTPRDAGSNFPLIAAIVGVAAMALAVGLFSGGYMDRHSESGRQLTEDAKLQIALQAFRSGHNAAALDLLMPMANAGDAKAQYWLADIYDNETGNKSDVVKAQVLLQTSAEHGFVPAESRLGALYLSGTENFSGFQQGSILA